MEPAMALTDAAIKALKPRDKWYAVSDERGLSLEVFPSGGLAWRYRHHLDGKLEKVALGKYPAITLKAARVKRDEMATMVANGQSPARKKQLRKVALGSSTTVQEFGERCFREIASRDRKDTSTLRRYRDRSLYPAFGRKPIGDVTVLDIQRLVLEKRDHGYPAAAADIRNLCKRVWDYAMFCGMATTNPALALPVRYIQPASGDAAVLGELSR